MARKFDFTPRFCKILEGELKYLGHPLYPNYDLGEEVPGNDRIKAPVDFAIETRDRLFLIEIEMHRADPSNNIAKIAYCLEKLRKDAIVIQWFSPYYKKRDSKLDKAKKVLAKYLGRQLLGERYYPIEYNVEKLDFEELYKTFERGKRVEVKEMDKVVKDASNQIKEKFTMWQSR